MNIVISSVSLWDEALTRSNTSSSTGPFSSAERLLLLVFVFLRKKKNKIGKILGFVICSGNRLCQWSKTSPMMMDVSHVEQTSLTESLLL